MAGEGWSYRKLAAKFKVSRGAVGNILKRVSNEQSKASYEQMDGKVTHEQKDDPKVSNEQPKVSYEQTEASYEQTEEVSYEQPKVSYEQMDDKVTTPKVAAVDDGLAGGIDVDKLRGWALRVRRESKAMASKVEGLTARLDALQKDRDAWNLPFAEGLPFRVRRRERREPLTVDELAAKMIGNGVDEATARRNAERIKANLRKAGAWRVRAIESHPAAPFADMGGPIVSFPSIADAEDVLIMAIRFNSTAQPTVRQKAFMLTLARSGGYPTIEEAYSALVDRFRRENEAEPLNPATYKAQLLRADAERGPGDITAYDCKLLLSLFKQQCR